MHTTEAMRDLMIAQLHFASERLVLQVRAGGRAPKLRRKKCFVGRVPPDVRNYPPSASIGVWK